MISSYLIQVAIVDHGCTYGVTGTAANRYPLLTLESNSKVPADTCTAADRRKRDFELRITTSNSGTMK
jgi:hypothetical protein